MDNPLDAVNQLVGDSGQSDSLQAVNAIVNEAPSDTTSPANVSNAQSQLGSQDDNGMCQKFVEEATYGKSGIFPSAIDAWEAYKNAGQAKQGDIVKAPSGALVYFAPDSSNQDFGHVGIADGKGNMISATDNGVAATPIEKWMNVTGQTPLGYVNP